MAGNMLFPEQESLFYEDRFLESWVGPIVTNPTTALVELVANSWDAYSTNVEITWPNQETHVPFSISDNGHGMTKQEFEYIWRALSYDRVSKHGSTVQPPTGIEGPPRSVFGRNGKGRFATFCFSDEYELISIKNGQQIRYRVYRPKNRPLAIEQLAFIENGVEGHGTRIIGTGEIPKIEINEDNAREILGSRFLANPSFKVYLNKKLITFNDISSSSFKSEILNIKNIGKIKIIHIDSKKADKTTKQHGIAWWALNRAVGECKWHSSDYQRILDGRTSEAKRFTFIVQADVLSEKDAIKEDWSWFKDDNETWKIVRPIVQDRIREIIIENSLTERTTKRQNVIDRIGNEVNQLSPLSRERIQIFISEVVNSCPNFGEQEIFQLSTILTKLEKAKSKFGILELLHKQSIDEIDDLHEVLSKWTIGMAKIVLDEIQNRLKIINELKAKIEIKGIDEVHELQPVFEKGLWMFGAEFESIEYTSNRGMTLVIQSLFKDKKTKGSLNRPDFVIKKDTSIGFYTRPSYDSNFDENGVDHLVIIDLKTTNIPLGSKEKDQIWKYVKELASKGHINNTTRVDGFVLGNIIEPGEESIRTELNDRVKIAPMLYGTILTRAEKRLLKLYDKVKEAPFLKEQQDELKIYTDPIPLNPTRIISEAL